MPYAFRWADLPIIFVLITVFAARASDAPPFDAKAFQAASAEASERCTALWSDHAFDPLREKIPLLGGVPTAAMLSNTERVRLEDKPLASRALKIAEQCKAFAAAPWAMLPPTTHAKVISVQRRADTLNKNSSMERSLLANITASAFKS
jgi:hypothetical protein